MQPGDKNREILEIYHFQRAVQLYQAELARTNDENINADNTDSLVGSCLLLAINEFCPPGFKPEHSWVFTSNPADLNWLALQGGLRCILGITGSFINTSIWGPAFQEAGDELKPFQGEQSGRSGIHNDLADLCDIEDHSTAEQNPYHWPTQLLSRMLALKPYNRLERYSIFVTWMGQIEPEFITLLRAKDERALLVLSWWMALMCAVSSFQVGTERFLLHFKVGVLYYAPANLPISWKHQYKSRHTQVNTVAGEGLWVSCLHRGYIWRRDFRVVSTTNIMYVVQDPWMYKIDMNNIDISMTWTDRDLT